MLLEDALQHVLRVTQSGSPALTSAAPNGEGGRSTTSSTGYGGGLRVHREAQAIEFMLCDLLAPLYYHVYKQFVH